MYRFCQALYRSSQWLPRGLRRSPHLHRTHHPTRERETRKQVIILTSSWSHLSVKEVWRRWVLIEKERPQVRPFFFQAPLNIDWTHYHSSRSRPGKQGHSATLSRRVTGQSCGPGARRALCSCSIPAPTPPRPLLTPSFYFLYKTFPEVCLCFHPPSPWHCKERNSLWFSEHRNPLCSMLASFHSLQVYMENVDSFNSGSITLSATQGFPQGRPRLVSHWFPGVLQGSVIQGTIASLPITVALGFCADSICLLLGTL